MSEISFRLPSLCRSVLLLKESSFLPSQIAHPSLFRGYSSNHFAKRKDPQCLLPDSPDVTFNIFLAKTVQSELVKCKGVAVATSAKEMLKLLPKFPRSSWPVLFNTAGDMLLETRKQSSINHVDVFSQDEYPSLINLIICIRIVIPRLTD